jgi:hypothetical protein
LLIWDRAQGYLTSRNLGGRYRRIEPPSSLNAIEVSNNYPKFSLKRKIYTFSAFDEMSGIEQAESICKYVQKSETANSKTFLDDLSYTLNDRRSLFSWRFAFHANSRNELISALSNEVKYVYSPKNVTIGFCFTGQGAQWYVLSWLNKSRSPAKRKANISFSGMPWDENWWMCILSSAKLCSIVQRRFDPLVQTGTYWKNCPDCRNKSSK